MSVKKQNFHTLIQDNILPKKNSYITTYNTVECFTSDINKDISIEEKINQSKFNIFGSFANFDNIVFSDVAFNPITIDYKYNEEIPLKQKSTSKELQIKFKDDTETFIFQDCIFNKEPIFTKNSITSILFNNCQFKCDIHNLLKKHQGLSLEIKFDNCKFDKIYFSKDNNINKFEIYGGEIDSLQINNQTFKEQFYINKQYSGNEQVTKIRELVIRDTTFHENFKLHNCKIEKIHIEDVDFEKHADFYMSNFKRGFDFNNIDDTEKENLNINFKAINFKGLAIFGDCTFHEKLIFEWVTFESFSHFRRTKFKKGLDLDYTNIEEEMNFFSVQELDTPQSKENTSQETYRIIKHNFEKIGNKIEANKYHALELEKRIENKDTPNSEKFILKIHHLTSRNGTNWWIPLLLIFLVGIITTIGLDMENPFSYYPSTKTTSIEENFFEIFKHIYILYKYKDLWDIHPFLLAFNKFSLGYLYYQFLIAVRKDTRK